MVHHNILLVLALFFLMTLLFLLSERLKVSYPIFLVIGGLGISFIPGAPIINIDPDIAFFVFLPPLLFGAAWYTSWSDFKRWRRLIFSMAFGLVFFTSIAVAYFAGNVIPGFTLALGFLLGGIISPPDAVAATAILKGLAIPKRGITLLEGESLVNDAASLTVFRFAIAAILTGQFTFKTAIIDFAILAVMGVFVGLVIGQMLYFVLRYWAKSSGITTPITLIAPYLMYIVAEELHWSGVLAVVSGGLFLSFHSKDFLNYKTRMQTKEVWKTVIFLLNGFVFILIGLELPVIMAGLGAYSTMEAIIYALMICGIVIAIRILLVYFSMLIPRFISKSVRDKENPPGLKLPFVIGWAGMRGVVSLASALAIPLTTDSGESFPHRNLILFITFVVILVTLLFQGLTLPLILKLLKLKEVDDFVPVSKQMENIRLLLAQESIIFLKHNYGNEIEQRDIIRRIYDQVNRSIEAIEEQDEIENRQLDFDQDLYRKVSLELIRLKREGLHVLNEKSQYDEEVVRDIEHNLDLEEARLNKK